jgi:general stress protein 26
LTNTTQSVVSKKNNITFTSDNHGSAVSFFGEGLQIGIFKLGKNKVYYDGKGNVVLRKNAKYVGIDVSINENFEGKYFNLGDFTDRGKESLLIIFSLRRMLMKWQKAHKNLTAKQCPFRVCLGNHDIDYGLGKNEIIKVIVRSLIRKKFIEVAIPVQFGGETVCVSHSAFSNNELEKLNIVFKEYQTLRKKIHITPGFKTFDLLFTEQFVNREEFVEMKKVFKENDGNKIINLTDEQKIKIRNAVGKSIVLSKHVDTMFNTNKGIAKLLKNNLFTCYVAMNRVGYKVMTNPSIGSDRELGNGIVMSCIHGHQMMSYTDKNGELVENDVLMVDGDKIALCIDDARNPVNNSLICKRMRQNTAGKTLTITLNTDLPFAESIKQIQVVSKILVFTDKLKLIEAEKGHNNKFFTQYLVVENEMDKLIKIIRSCETTILSTCGFEYPESRTILNKLNQNVDGLVLHFFTNKDSPKIEQIQKYNKCSLYYLNPERKAIRVFGEVKILKSNLGKYWDDSFKKFGYTGSFDENYNVLEFVVKRVKYYSENMKKDIVF